MRSHWCSSLGCSFFTPFWFLCCSRLLLIEVQQEGATEGQSWSRAVWCPTGRTVAWHWAHIADGACLPHGSTRVTWGAKVTWGVHYSSASIVAIRRCGEAKGNLIKAQLSPMVSCDMWLGKQRILRIFNLERRSLGNSIGTISQYLKDCHMEEELGLFLCFQSTLLMEMGPI